MKRFVPAFAVPLTLALGLVQGDGSLPSAAPLAPQSGLSYSVNVLPGTLGQTAAPYSLVPIKPGKQAQPLYQLRRSRPPVYGPGDGIPHSYTVYGLRTGPGGMAFTNRNGAVLPVPSDPHVITGPFFGLPIRPAVKVPPHARMMPHFIPLPTPKK